MYYQNAFASIKGAPSNPNIRGTVGFYDIIGGTMVFAQIYGLPDFNPSTNGTAQIGPFGFHIHQNGSCEIGDDPKSPFKAAGEHWNPYNQPHGNHASDFPVLFSNNGYSYMTFFTNKFKPQDVVGKTVIIHESPDDYHTQPAGNAGKRIGCGLIIPFIINQ